MRKFSLCLYLYLYEIEMSNKLIVEIISRVVLSQITAVDLKLRHNAR